VRSREHTAFSDRSAWNLEVVRTLSRFSCQRIVTVMKPIHVPQLEIIGDSTAVFAWQEDNDCEAAVSILFLLVPLHKWKGNADHDLKDDWIGFNM
jgi:hypothetical protein